MPKFLRPYAPALVFIAGSALLILILLLEWWLDHNRRAGLTTAASPAPVEIAVDTETGGAGLKAIEEYAQLVERPLFQESRRPVEAEVTGGTGTVEQTPLDFKLMGVVHTPQGTSALFMDATNKYKKARLNAAVNGWTLVKIDDDRVTLEQSGEQKELRLLKPKPKIAPAQPPKGKAQVSAGQPPAEGENADESNPPSADDEMPSDEATQP